MSIPPWHNSGAVRRLFSLPSVATSQRLSSWPRESLHLRCGRRHDDRQSRRVRAAAGRGDHLGDCQADRRNHHLTAAQHRPRAGPTRPDQRRRTAQQPAGLPTAQGRAGEDVAAERAAAAEQQRQVWCPSINTPRTEAEQWHERDADRRPRAVGGWACSGQRAVRNGPPTPELERVQVIAWG